MRPSLTTQPDASNESQTTIHDRRPTVSRLRDAINGQRDAIATQRDAVLAGEDAAATRGPTALALTDVVAALRLEDYPHREHHNVLQMDVNDVRRRDDAPRRRVQGQRAFIHFFTGGVGMDARQQKKLNRFGQVLTFLDANTTVVPPTAVATQRQILLVALAQIAGFARDQVTKGNESVVAQTLSSARIALRDTHMRQLSTVGLYHLTGKDPGDADIPNGTNIFTLPPTRTHALTLINSAQAMLAAATPYASVFAAAGVDLTAAANAVQALQDAVDANDLAKRTSKGATQGIVSEIQTAERAVRMMDVVIRPLLVSNKARLTQWESVKRAAGGLNLTTPNPVTLATPAATAPSAASSAPATTATSSQGGAAA